MFPFIINMAVPFFMIITAFNYCISYERNNISKLTQMYNVHYIEKKFNRLFLPFIVVALIEYFFIIPTTGYNHKFTTFIINGGYGPGSYYFPVMIQLMILFPLLYTLIKKFKEQGLILIFLINFLFEFFFAVFSIEVSLYRLLFFRYLLFIGLGIYGFLVKDKLKNSTLKYSFLIGLFYIILSTYCIHNIFYPFIYWKNTSMLSVFYVFAIFMYCFTHHKNFVFKNKIHNILETIGNASWHIFLIQMIFFVIQTTAIFRMDISHKYNLLLDIILKVVICCTIGVLYYLLEKNYIKYIKPFIRKKR